MGTIIIRNAVKREKGKLYYIDAEGNVCEAILKRGRGKPTSQELLKGVNNGHI